MLGQGEANVRKRLPTRAEFERLAKLLYLLDGTFRELTTTESSLGRFLPVHWVDLLSDCGAVGKRINLLRSKLDDLACLAERSHTATSVFYSNRDAERLTQKHIQVLLMDSDSFLPDGFMVNSELSPKPK